MEHMAELVLLDLSSSRPSPLDYSPKTHLPKCSSSADSSPFHYRYVVVMHKGSLHTPIDVEGTGHCSKFVKEEYIYIYRPPIYIYLLNRRMRRPTSSLSMPSTTYCVNNVITFKRGRRVLGGAARTADLLWNMSAWSLSVVPVRLSCALLD